MLVFKYCCVVFLITRLWFVHQPYPCKTNRASAQEQVWGNQKLLTLVKLLFSCFVQVGDCFDLTSRECIICILPAIKTSLSYSFAACYSGLCQCLGGSGPLPATVLGNQHYCACLWYPNEWRLTSSVGGKEKDSQDDKALICTWEKYYIRSLTSWFLKQSTEKVLFENQFQPMSHSKFSS